MTVAELQQLLTALVATGSLDPQAEVVLSVNEDFADLDFVDHDCDPEGCWLCGTSDEEHTRAWRVREASEDAYT